MTPDEPGRAGEESDALSLAWRIRLRWWAFCNWLRHCPDCGQRGYYPDAPRWEDDKVAAMLGLITDTRCKCCGKDRPSS